MYTLSLLSRSVAITIICLVATTFTSVTKAATVDFTPFKGKYNGSWQIVNGPVSEITTTSIRVKVPTNGKTMTMTITGTILINNQLLPILTTLKFKQNRRLTSDAFLMGFTGPAATLAAKYKYLEKKKSFTFLQIAAPGATLLSGLVSISGTMNYSLRFSKSYKALTIIGAGTVTTNAPTSLNIQIQAKRRGGK